MGEVGYVKMFKISSIFLLTVPRGCFFVDPLWYLRLSLLYRHVCSLQPYGHLLGKADLLTLLCVMFSCDFVTFPYSAPGQV